MEERIVLRCKFCNLNQFVLDNDKCRKCGKLMEFPKVEVKDTLASEEFPALKRTALDEYREIPLRLNFFRLQQGLSRVALAQRCKTTCSWYSRISGSSKKSECSVGMLEKLVEGLGLTMSDFFSMRLGAHVSEFDTELLLARRTLEKEHFEEILTEIKRRATPRHSPLAV